MKEHCGRCRMSFRVEEPLLAEPAEIEQLKCPDCNRRFWSANAWIDDWECVAAVGIFPADAKRIE